MMKSLAKLFSLLMIVFVVSCDSGPKVIESDSTTDQVSATSIPALQEASNTPSNTSTSTGDTHQVLVEDVLNTDKYTYLHVTEEDKKYWIAISKREVEIGETYYYKGGLLKKNFFSQEFNRVFETVYLVSNIWKQPNGDDATLDAAFAQMEGGQALPNLEVGDIQPAEGAVKLAEIYANKEKFNGQTIKVTGKCVKVNPMIMNRNWIHIQDGSGDDLDLTITTTENIPLGSVVTMEGTIALDKDFGAGYRYNVIMEGAVLWTKN